MRTAYNGHITSAKTGPGHLSSQQTPGLLLVLHERMLDITFEKRNEGRLTDLLCFGEGVSQFP